MELFFAKHLRTIIAGGLVLLLLILVLSTAMCGRDDTAARQAEQTNKSGEAITAAASDAIETIGNRVANDKTVDTAVTGATKGIDNAQTVDDIRRSVIDGLCRQDAHRLDPACRVRRSDPQGVQ